MKMEGSLTKQHCKEIEGEISNFDRRLAFKWIPVWEGGEKGGESRAEARHKGKGGAAPAQRFGEREKGKGSQGAPETLRSACRRVGAMKKKE